MGSLQPPDQVAVSGASGKRKEVTVLVTGFGPFQTKYPVNPSFEITQSLPASIPAPTADGSQINIISYGTPIRVCYEEVQELVPKLHEAYIDTVDLVLHIGMASGRNFYALEQIAHRDGYHKHKDLDDRTLPEDDGLIRFPDCQEHLTTSLDYAEVLRRWQSIILGLPEDSAGFDADCRPSHDAGHYLCDYTYFSSLAWYGRRSGSVDGGKPPDRPVLFLHVPADSDEQTLARGRVVTMALIEAMAGELHHGRAGLRTSKSDNGQEIRMD